MLEWAHLTDSEHLHAIDEESETQAVVILKHSTRCSISAMALGRLQRNYQEVQAQFYYLDLLKYRSISNTIATRYKVHHESPQLLLIHKGECIFESSHMDIEFAELKDEIEKLTSSLQN